MGLDSMFYATKDPLSCNTEFVYSYHDHDGDLQVRDWDQFGGHWTRPPSGDAYPHGELIFEFRKHTDLHCFIGGFWKMSSRTPYLHDDLPKHDWANYEGPIVITPFILNEIESTINERFRRKIIPKSFMRRSQRGFRRMEREMIRRAKVVMDTGYTVFYDSSW